ncbi:bifunctional nicotinamidase/pyrazinamidase [Arcticibacter sp. MXS-1]|uniref:bifunctional nicotinamidase/pyrazinamidase n=1 Tax=Arcticibacter sp. MXS-1 TaxID=3341726 RepID=UPI0035A837F9
MKALLIIDIQNDFLSGGALAVPQGDEVIPEINRLQEQYPLVIASQDWHPRGHKSFASSHAGKSLFSRIELNGLEQVLWPDHCVQGTDGAALSAQLDQRRIETIFRKGTDPGTDSYSAFYDNGRKKATGLTEYLRGKKVSELHVAGLAADYCVYYSVKDALAEGFETVLIENATRAIDPAAFTEIKKDILQRGGTVLHL